MKGKIAVLALIAVLVFGMNISNALAGNSFNFLGETAWKVHVTESTGQIPPDLDMTGAISKLGPNYYLFQGVVQMPEGIIDNPFFLSGGGTLVTLPGAQTQTLVLTLNTSQLHVDTVDPVSSNRDTGIMHVEINPSTMSGNFYEVGHDYDKTPGTFDQRFSAGQVNFNGTLPYPLSPSSTAPLMGLLLE